MTAVTLSYPSIPTLPSPPGIVEQLVDCSGGDEVSEESGFRRKAAALFAVLQEQRAQRAIVFCNKIDTCGWQGLVGLAVREDDKVA